MAGFEPAFSWIRTTRPLPAGPHPDENDLASRRSVALRESNPFGLIKGQVLKPISEFVSSWRGARSSVPAVGVEPTAHPASAGCSHSEVHPELAPSPGRHAGFREVRAGRPYNTRVSVNASPLLRKAGRH